MWICIMIFVTVGTQLPFDRLVSTVDKWAQLRGRSDLFAQIGPSRLRPKYIRWCEFLDAGQFEQMAAQAEAIVSHAGTGTIITALDLGKPILVMPRRAALRETRSDHQVATVKWLQSRAGVIVAMDETELMARLDELPQVVINAGPKPQASSMLLEKIAAFIKRSGA